MLLPHSWLRRNPHLPGEVETVLPGSRCSDCAAAALSGTCLHFYSLRRSTFPSHEGKGPATGKEASREASTSSCRWANLPQESQPSRAPFPNWPAPLQPSPTPISSGNPSPQSTVGRLGGLAWAGSSWARRTGLRSLHGRGTGAEMLGAEDVDQAS